MGQIIMGWVLPSGPHTGDVEDYQENNCILDTQVPRTLQNPNQPQTPPVDDLPPEPESEPCGIFDCVDAGRPQCFVDV